MPNHLRALLRGAARLGVLVLIALLLWGSSRPGEASGGEGAPREAAEERDGAEFPAWFRRPSGISGETVAVGYARSYRNRDTSTARAARDALERLRSSYRDTLLSELLFRRGVSGLLSRRGEFIHLASARESELPGHAYLDTARAAGMTLVLASTDTTASVLPTGAAAFPEERPAWIRDPPRTSSRPIGLGQAPRYYYEHRSWIRAERQARQQIALQSGTRVSRLERSSEAYSDAVTSLRTAAVLHGAETIRRWRGPRSVYVLVRADRIEYLPIASP